jgi:cytoskeletal protein RodZ
MTTIGQQLKQTREAKRVSIDQAEQATRVRAAYIHALEADDYSAMPSPVQGRGFLRLYADYLGLDVEAMISRQKEEAEAKPELITPQMIDHPTPAPSAKPIIPPPPIVDPEPHPEPDLEPEPIINAEPAIRSLSQTIFNEIGQTLRARRELLSLTLDEIERYTHVRKHNLQFIEDGAFHELHSPVQARGMLNAYARFLDLDAEALLLRFADGLQIQREERHPRIIGRSERRQSLIPLWARSLLSVDLIVGGGLIITIVMFVIWGAARILDIQAGETTQDSAPSISDVLLASPVATIDISFAPLVTDTPLPILDGSETPTLSAEVLPTLSTFNVQVTVIVRERAFIRVIVDGENKLDGRIAPGGAYTFEGNEKIEVLTGNGSAVQIIYNQRDMGAMGSFGEVVNLIYTSEDVLFPTPTDTPKATATSKYSATPTLRPTNTPVPTIQQ